MTPEEIKRFLASTDKNRLFGFFALALACGARAGELQALRWEDVDFEAGTVHFRRTVSEVRGRQTVKEPKKSRGKRLVQLPRFVVEVLHEQRKANLAEGLGASGLCFQTRNGARHRLANIRRRYFKPALRDADLPETIRLHDLRHSSATWLLSLGMSAQDVSRILGHCNAAFTVATYTHALQSSLSAALAKMDEQMGS